MSHVEKFRNEFLYIKITFALTICIEILNLLNNKSLILAYAALITDTTFNKFRNVFLNTSAPHLAIFEVNIDRKVRSEFSKVKLTIKLNVS